MERLTYYDGIAVELKDGTRIGIDDAIEKLAVLEDAEEQGIISKEVADLIHGRRTNNERGC